MQLSIRQARPQPSGRVCEHRGAFTGRALRLVTKAGHKPDTPFAKRECPVDEAGFPRGRRPSGAADVRSASPQTTDGCGAIRTGALLAVTRHHAKPDVLGAYPHGLQDKSVNECAL